MNTVFDRTHNESVIAGLFRAIELVEHATKSGLNVRMARATSDDPLLSYYRRDEVPDPRFSSRR